MVASSPASNGPHAVRGPSRIGRRRPKLRHAPPQANRYARSRDAASRRKRRRHRCDRDKTTLLKRSKTCERLPPAVSGCNMFCMRARHEGMVRCCVYCGVNGNTATTKNTTLPLHKAPTGAACGRATLYMCRSNNTSKQKVSPHVSISMQAARESRLNGCNMWCMRARQEGMERSVMYCGVRH